MTVPGGAPRERDQYGHLEGRRPGAARVRSEQEREQRRYDTSGCHLLALALMPAVARPAARP